jgi:hypothetical protein
MRRGHLSVNVRPGLRGVSEKGSPDGFLAESPVKTVSAAKNGALFLAGVAAELHILFFFIPLILL